MKDIFISYTKEDKAIARKLVSKLEADGYSCWITPRDSSNLDSEKDFEQAIGNCKIFILMLSKFSENSTEIYSQLEKAVDNDKYIIPFKLDEIGSTLGLKYLLHTVEWVDAVGDGFTDAYEVLKEIIVEVFGGKIPEKRTPKVVVISETKEIKKNSIIIGILGVLVLVFAFLYFTTDNSNKTENNISNNANNVNIPNINNEEFEALTADELNFVGSWKIVDYADNRQMTEAERIQTLQSIENLKRNALVVFNGDRTFKRAGFAANVENGLWEYNSDKKQISLKSAASSQAGILNILEFSETTLTIVVLDNIPNASGGIDQVTTKITMKKQ